MTEVDSPPLLFWEDEAAGSRRWWLARARESLSEGRTDYFIAEDDLTATLVAVALPPRARRYKVVAVAPFGEDVSPAEALISLKKAVLVRRQTPGENGVRRSVNRWRAARFAGLLRRDLPLALAGLAGGAMLGFAVAFVAVSSRFSGWPLAAAGVVIGATAGPALKHLVNRTAAEAYPRPWARFAVASVAGIAGAFAAAGIVLTLHWS